MNTIADICQLPSVTFYKRADLPSVAGIYFVVEDIWEPILCYVGQARNIRHRWSKHHRAGQMAPPQIIHWLPCPDSLERRCLEGELIHKFKPLWNYKTSKETIRDLTCRLWYAETTGRSLWEQLDAAEAARIQQMPGYDEVVAILKASIYPRVEVEEAS